MYCWKEADGVEGFYDCNYACTNRESYENWIGDTVCDTGGIDLNCEKFEYDGGDCEEGQGA